MQARRAGHDIGRDVCDVAIPDGAVAISDVQYPRGPVRSARPGQQRRVDPSTWRALADIANTPGMLGAIRLARAQARNWAWVARAELTCAEPPGSGAAVKTTQAVIDLDATLVTGHLRKKVLAATLGPAAAITRSGLD